MVAVAEKQEQIKRIEVQLIDLKLQLRMLETEIIELDRKKLDINKAALAEAKHVSPENAAAVIERARRDVADTLDQIQKQIREIKQLKEVIAAKEAERKTLFSALF